MFISTRENDAYMEQHPDRSHGAETPPHGLGFWHPAALLATWFGAGRLPKAPGTWGSLAALPFAWTIHAAFGAVGLAIATVVVFGVGLWASSIYVRRTGVADPGAIVIDEVAGQWLTLLPVGTDPILYAAGFVLFRVADIWKPWPVSWADRSLAGGFGVMADDILAGIFAGAALYTLAWAMGV